MCNYYMLSKLQKSLVNQCKYYPLFNLFVYLTLYTWFKVNIYKIYSNIKISGKLSIHLKQFK